MTPMPSVPTVIDANWPTLAPIFWSNGLVSSRIKIKNLA